MRIKTTGIFITLFTAFVLTVMFVPNAFSLTFDVQPERIAINSLYHGSALTVTGEVAPEDDIIVKFSSPDKQAHLRQKGKKGGLLWMNVGELEFKPVSDVYLVYSTGDVDSILSLEEQDKYLLGYGSFKRVVEVSPVSDESEKEKWVEEFLKFKEDSMIYGVYEEGIETNMEDGKKTFQLTVDWPYQAPPQEYTVSVYAVNSKSVKDYRETSLAVETVGALKFISGKAFNSASVYGIASILIAIAAGFIVSVIFKGGGGGH